MKKLRKRLKRLLSCFAVAAVSVGLAVVINLTLGSMVKHSATLFLCSVMLSSWYGGIWSGICAAVLSVIGLDYFFLPPLYALGISLEDTPDVAMFVVAALFISWLSDEQKRAKESLRQARDQLDAKIKARTAELESTNLRLKTEIIERETAEERLADAHSEIARIAKLTMMGEFAASIAHELNQPLGSIVVSGDASLRWLDAEPPNLEEVRQALTAIIRDGTRASSVLVRIRGLLRQGERIKEALGINDVIREVIAFSEAELRRSAVSMRTELCEMLPPVLGDRILLQQVLINLIVNAMEAMRPVTGRTRNLLIRTELEKPSSIAVLVRDSGVGIDPRQSSRIFDAFYTTKAQGIGMGLTISRSIVEAHGGRLRAIPNDESGATFHFTLPIRDGAQL